MVKIWVDIQCNRAMFLNNCPTACATVTILLQAVKCVVRMDLPIIVTIELFPPQSASNKIEADLFPFLDEEVRAF